MSLHRVQEKKPRVREGSGLGGRICRAAMAVVAGMFAATGTVCAGGKLDVSLKREFKNYFLVGTALNVDQILGRDAVASNLLKTHFNSATAENAMKWEKLQPTEGRYDFRVADALVDLGEKRDLEVIGHTLVWHQQTPDWVFEGLDGERASREQALDRLRKHIYTVVGRYKGRVHGWDVANETFNDDGSWRKSAWYQAIGSDYVAKAFQFAREADPTVELYYNDYNLFKPAKRGAVIELVRNLREKGLRVDAVGLQGHYGIDYPILDEFDAALKDFSVAGIRTMVTELDITLLPFPDAEEAGADISVRREMRDEWNPFPQGLPAAQQKELADRYASLFGVMLKHSRNLDRVTFWGVTDADSWRNNWPIRGRADYPLLFDRKGEPKKAFRAVVREAREHGED